MPVPSKSGPSQIREAVQMEPERLWREGFVKEMGFRQVKRRFIARNRQSPNRVKGRESDRW